MLVASREETESQQRTEQVALFPLGPLPHAQHHRASMRVTPLWGIPKSPPIYVTGAPKQKKNGPNERTEQSSTNNTAKQ